MAFTSELHMHHVFIPHVIEDASSVFSLVIFALEMSVPSSQDGHKVNQSDNASTEDQDALQLVIPHSRRWVDLSGMMR